MRLFVAIVLTMLLSVFIIGSTPVSSTPDESPIFTDLVKVDIAFITAILAIISTVLSFIYQWRYFKLEFEKHTLELKKFQKEYASIDQSLCSLLDKAEPQLHFSTSQADFPSPYICGPPIIHCEDFYGRHQIAEEILRDSACGRQMHSISIVGSPLSGKTSLLNYIRHPHTLKKYNLTNIIPVYLNFEAGINNPSDFFARLLNETLEAMRRYNILPKPNHLDTKDIEYSVVEHFYETASEKFKFLLIIDNFEKFNPSALDSIFFGNLRSLSMNRPIAWITTSHKPLSQIFYKKFGTMTSPYINPFLKNIVVPPLSEENARTLARQPAMLNRRPFTPDEVEFIIKLDRLMPFEIQVASDALYHQKITHPNEPKIYRDLARKEYKKNMNKHYQRYWRKLEIEEQAILTNIASGNIGSTKEISDLVDHGYIREENNSYKIVGAIFKDWIIENN